jgi:hypothetical protein
MNTRSICAIVSTIYLACVAASANAAQGVREIPSIADRESENLNVRKSAFMRVIGLDNADARLGLAGPAARLLSTSSAVLPDSDERRLALIDMAVAQQKRLANLEAENNRLKARGAPVPEDIQFPDEEHEFYGDLILVVSSLEDSRALPFLVSALKTGAMASRAVIAFGIPAVMPVVDQLDSPDVDVRTFATGVLWNMLRQSDVISKDAASRGTIKSALLRAAADSNYRTRRAAVLGLSTLDDAESTAVLYRLAQSDPYYETIEGRAWYPVRVVASAELRRDGVRPSELK